MGREIRRVPANWEHPRTDKYYDGRYQPMHDETFDSAAEDWKERFAEWERGERPEYFDAEKYGHYEFWEWDTSPPDREYYRPYKDEDATWYQVYETVSEGTPVTPPFSTQDELIDYLVKNGDFWDQKDGRGGYTKEQAECFVKENPWVPSMIINTGTWHVLSGIECVDVTGKKNDAEPEILSINNGETP